VIDKIASPDDAGLVYDCASDITWVRDADRILLVDAKKEQFWSLQGVEAAMWDWLTLAYPYEKIVRFLSLLSRVPAGEAERKFLTTLRGWQELGIVQAVEEKNRGEPGDQCCL
jgi:hypothetical protein